MRLETQSNEWKIIFNGLREDILSDRDFLNKCAYQSPISLYEEELSKRGITMVRNYSTVDEIVWTHAEFLDDIYIELLLRWT